MTVAEGETEESDLKEILELSGLPEVIGYQARKRNTKGLHSINLGECCVIIKFTGIGVQRNELCHIDFELDWGIFYKE